MLSLVLVWGSSFILMKKGLESFDSSEVAAVRMTSAFLFMLPFGIRHFKNIPADRWKYITISGFIGYFIPAFLFTKAQTHIESSISGILNSATPLFTLIVGLSFFKFRTKWYNVAGVFIGLAGAIGLLYFSSKGNIYIDFEYGSLILLATLLYAININNIKTNLRNINPTSISVFMFLIVGPFAIIYLLFFTRFLTHFTLSTKTTENLSYILILGVVGSAIATIVYNHLIKKTNVLFAASVTYLMPVIAIMWGLLDGEVFKLIYISFIILILSGVFLVNYTFKAKKA